MSNETSNSILRLEASERARLGEAMRVLLDRGSILGGEGPHADLYNWAYANRPWLEEMSTIFELQLFWENDQRLVQAVPQARTFLLRLRLDATLVLLTLWYEFDTAIRDRSETPPIVLSVEQLNEALLTKFDSLRRAMPSPTRRTEILRLAQRKNLVRLTSASNSAQTRIEILPTIKRVIPFQDLADWTRHTERFLAAENGAGTNGLEVNEDAEN